MSDKRNETTLDRNRSDANQTRKCLVGRDSRILVRVLFFVRSHLMSTLWFSDFETQRNFDCYSLTCRVFILDIRNLAEQKGSQSSFH